MHLQTFCVFLFFIEFKCAYTAIFSSDIRKNENKSKVKDFTLKFDKYCKVHSKQSIYQHEDNSPNYMEKKLLRTKSGIISNNLTKNKLELAQKSSKNEKKEALSLKKYKKLNLDGLVKAGFCGNTLEWGKHMVQYLGNVYSYANQLNIRSAAQFSHIYTKLAYDLSKIYIEGIKGNIIEELKKEHNGLHNLNINNIETYKKHLEKICVSRKNYVKINAENIMKVERILENAIIVLNNGLKDVSKSHHTIVKLFENCDNLVSGTRKFCYITFNKLLGPNRIGDTMFFLSSLLSNENLLALKFEKKTSETLRKHFNSLNAAIKKAKRIYQEEKKKFLRIFNLNNSFNICKLKYFLKWYFSKYEDGYNDMKEDVLLLLGSSHLELNLRQELVKMLSQKKKCLRKFELEISLYEKHSEKSFPYERNIFINEENMISREKWNTAAQLLESLIFISKLTEILLSLKDIVLDLELIFNKLKMVENEYDIEEVKGILKSIHEKYEESSNNIKIFNRWSFFTSKINHKGEELLNFELENKFILSMMEHTVEQCNIFYYLKGKLSEKEHLQLSKKIFFSLNFILMRLFQNNAIFI